MNKDEAIKPHNHTQTPFSIRCPFCLKENISTYELKSIIENLKQFSKSPEFKSYSESYRQGYEECLEDLEYDIKELEEKQ